MNRTNLLKRVGLAAVGIPAIYFCLKQSGFLLLLAVDIIVVFCIIEFRSLSGKLGYSLNLPLTIAGGLLISWDIPFSGGERVPFILLMVSIAASFAGLFRQDRRSIIPDTACTVFGSFFFAFSIGCLILVRHLPSGFHYTVLIFALIWMCDTTAYFTGTSIGRNKLWPQVSPKKTIEGFIGGFVGSCLTALAAKLFFLPHLTVFDCLIMGGIAGVLGQGGDLVESAFKRSADVKDSSQILPGHGGFLDRFDSFFFTVPAIYLYIQTYIVS